MNDTQPPADDAADIEAAFGHRWKVWRSDTGRWWAARSTPPTVADRATGCPHFLRAMTPGELSGLIHDQEQLSARTPDPTQSRPPR